MLGGDVVLLGEFVVVEFFCVVQGMILRNCVVCGWVV